MKLTIFGFLTLLTVTVIAVYSIRSSAELTESAEVSDVDLLTANSDDILEKGKEAVIKALSEGELGLERTLQEAGVSPERIAEAMSEYSKMKTKVKEYPATSLLDLKTYAEQEVHNFTQKMKSSQSE